MILSLSKVSVSHDGIEYSINRNKEEKGKRSKSRRGKTNQKTFHREKLTNMTGWQGIIYFIYDFSAGQVYRIVLLEVIQFTEGIKIKSK